MEKRNTAEFLCCPGHLRFHQPCEDGPCHFWRSRPKPLFLRHHVLWWFSSTEGRIVYLVFFSHSLVYHWEQDIIPVKIYKHKSPLKALLSCCIGKQRFHLCSVRFQSRTNHLLITVLGLISSQKWATSPLLDAVGDFLLALEAALAIVLSSLKVVFHLNPLPALSLAAPSSLYFFIISCTVLPPNSTLWQVHS